MSPRAPIAALAISALLAGAPAAGGGTRPGGAFAARTAQADRAAAWGARQVGVQEIGTTNCGRTVVRWQRNAGFRIPPCRVWCGIFVHEAFRQGGVDLSARWIDPEHVYYDALANRRHLHAIRPLTVRRGDVLLFRYRRDKRASHAAIVTRRLRGAIVYTVEGNTENRVRRKVHRIGTAVLALRVDPAVETGSVRRGWRFVHRMGAETAKE